MYHERKFEFQAAARKRAAGEQVRLACSLAAKRPPLGSAFIVARTDPTFSDRRDGAASAPDRSRAVLHGFPIVTPRLEFAATLTKQSLGRISNRYKIAAFTSGFPAPARNRQEPSPPEFLIANLELEFFLRASKSAKYNFLIANKRGFCIRRGRIGFVPRNLFLHAGI